MKIRYYLGLPVLALGFMLLAGSASALTANEIYWGQLSSSSQVKGETQYQQVSVTTPSYKVVKIKAQPTGFADGLWTYTISWSRVRAAQGSIYINGSVLDAEADQISQADIQLKPKARTKVEFYSLPNKKGTLLVRKYFITLAAPKNDAVACTADAMLCSDGKTYVSRSGTNCEFKACPSDQPLAICDYAAPPAGCNYVQGPNFNSQTQCGMVLNCPAQSTSTPAAASVSVRYIKDSITKSGWVAIREMEFYGPDGGKLKPVGATASCDWCNYGTAPDYNVGAKGVIDGDTQKVWNAGETADNCSWYVLHTRDDGIYGYGCSPGKIRKAWLQVDFGATVQVSKIRILPMGQSTDRVDELSGSTDGQTYTAIGTLKASATSPASDDKWIEYIVK